MAIAQTAIIDKNAQVAHSAQVWHHSQIREFAIIGKNTIIGKNVYIGARVEIGANCKIQNGAQIYEESIIEEGVFVGPGVVLTNDRYPRAVTPEENLKKLSDWTPQGVVVGKGSSIGANATCVAPVKIGSWAVIGAGSVVTRNVQNYALAVGNPAKRIAWVGEFGVTLKDLGNSIYECPKTGKTYLENGDNLTPCDSQED
jgi:acetyltransferase-like isoleucine patch superfamily enzyme